MHSSDDLIPMLFENLFLRTKQIVLGHLGRQLIVNPESDFSVQEEGGEGPLMCWFRETGYDGGGDTVIGAASVFIRVALNTDVGDVCREGHCGEEGETGDWNAHRL
jgi:hypothetical protein